MIDLLYRWAIGCINFLVNQFDRAARLTAVARQCKRREVGLGMTEQINRPLLTWKCFAAARKALTAKAERLAPKGPLTPGALGWTA